MKQKGTDRLQKQRGQSWLLPYAEGSWNKMRERERPKEFGLKSGSITVELVQIVLRADVADLG